MCQHALTYAMSNRNTVHFSLYVLAILRETAGQHCLKFMLLYIRVTSTLMEKKE